MERQNQAVLLQYWRYMKMSNPIYYECKKCLCLMNEKRDSVKCPNCKNAFVICDGSNYPDEDDADYNNGFRRKTKRKIKKRVKN